MKYYLKIFIIAVSFGLAAMFAGCSSDGCTENRNAVPLAEFKSSPGGSSITLDSLTIAGVDAPNDTLLSKVGTSISQVYLPMRPTHQSVKWCFSYKWKRLDYPQLNDTLTIDYSSQPYFASEECGAYYRYRINRLDVTDHLIDSVAIVDSVITNIDKVYLNIYFRTGDSEQ